MCGCHPEECYECKMGRCKPKNNMLPPKDKKKEEKQK